MAADTREFLRALLFFSSLVGMYELLLSVMLLARCSREARPLICRCPDLCDTPSVTVEGNPMMKRTAVTLALVGLMLPGMGAIASPALAETCNPATDVLFNRHCFYLDGSGGVCDPGYALASQSVLTSIASEFAGKTYKHQVSDNCCIYNSDPVEDWATNTPAPPGHCNRPGQFNADEPSFKQECDGATNLRPNQLTLCGSLFTVATPAPALAHIPLAGLGALLIGGGIWLTRRRSRSAS